MLAVIFEVVPSEQHRQTYFDWAAALLPELKTIDGFLGIERFQSLSDPTKLLSLSYWRDEKAVMQWRQFSSHRDAQKAGRSGVFLHYRLRVVRILRDYGMEDREEAPEDSRQQHMT